jgi:hypothetical protein
MSHCNNFVVFNIHVKNIEINKSVSIYHPDTSKTILRLKGIIYWSNNHFTCRFVDCNRMVWCHDGITNKKECVQESELVNFTAKKLSTYKSAMAVLAIYVKI